MPGNNWLSGIFVSLLMVEVIHLIYGLNKPYFEDFPKKFVSLLPVKVIHVKNRINKPYFEYKNSVVSLVSLKFKTMCMRELIFTKNKFVYIYRFEKK